MSKIKVLNPIVELDGDEMARIIWRHTRELLVNPYVDLDIKYFDLCLDNREFTQDVVTTEAAEAVLKYRIGVKCASLSSSEEQLGANQFLAPPTQTIQNILNANIITKNHNVEKIPFKTSEIFSTKKSIVVSETTHGTISNHFKLQQQSASIFTSPFPTIFVWTSALAQRAKLDDNTELNNFVSLLESLSLDVLNNASKQRALTTLEIFSLISENLNKEFSE